MHEPAAQGCKSKNLNSPFNIIIIIIVVLSKGGKEILSPVHSPDTSCRALFFISKKGQENKQVL